METSDHAADDDDAGRSGAPPEDPAAAASALLGGKIAGRYELLAVLGVGALGRVFRARAIDGGAGGAQVAEVALKLLHDRHAGDAVVLERFAREVSAARDIDHPCVVRVLDSGVDERGRPFVCMECIEGVSLAQVLRDEELTPRRIEALLVDVLSGLSAAHRKGVVHRDLKPENVLITREADGRESAKLCDFGVAKILKQELSSALTMEGMLCGTPEYMAPEQASGKNLDGRVDVYSVGVVLYQMLTRELPFQGRSPVATAAMHAADPVIEPRKRRPDRPVPWELEAVCMKALEKRPSRRYQTAIEMSEALRQAVKQLDGRADVPLGSSAFGQSVAQISRSAAPERMTVPGAAVRSSTLVWSGAILLLGASLALAIPWLTGDKEGARMAREKRSPELRVAATKTPARAPAPALSKGEEAFEEGKRRLRRNDLAGAVRMLAAARDELGERPDVLRALGEAQIKQGDAAKGRETLSRYLELAPEARDRAIVEALIRTAAKP